MLPKAQRKFIVRTETGQFGNRDSIIWRRHALDLREPAASPHRRPVAEPLASTMSLSAYEVARQKQMAKPVKIPRNTRLQRCN